MKISKTRIIKRTQVYRVAEQAKIISASLADARDFVKITFLTKPIDAFKRLDHL